MERADGRPVSFKLHVTTTSQPTPGYHSRVSVFFARDLSLAAIKKATAGVAFGVSYRLVAVFADILLGIADTLLAFFFA